MALKTNFAMVFIVGVLEIAVVSSEVALSNKVFAHRDKPHFLAEVPNITVAVGRDAIIPCVVDNLQDYRVAFIHLDRQMILSIHNNVITRIPRFGISHDKHHTWSLHIKNVQKEDQGHYMCQINTDPMLSKVGVVNVVVPPNIIDHESSPSMVTVREEHNATLICKAEGTPQPRIKWQREDKKPIVIKRRKKEGRKELLEYNGEVLDLIRVSRTEMGAYLCIASNDVPPAISKRIIVTVEFSPMIWIPQQLIGAPLGTTVKLECHTESSPRAISYWEFQDEMVLNSERITASESYHSNYKLDAFLTIRDLQPQDFGTYKCISKNSLGEMEGSIMLYELQTTTETKTIEGPDSYSYFEEPANEQNSNGLEQQENDLEKFSLENDLSNKYTTIQQQDELERKRHNKRRRKKDKLRNEDDSGSNRKSSSFWFKDENSAHRMEIVSSLLLFCLAQFLAFF